jgi:hypothetical protein
MGAAPKRCLDRGEPLFDRPHRQQRFETVRRDGGGRGRARRQLDEALDLFGGQGRSVARRDREEIGPIRMGPAQPGENAGQGSRRRTLGILQDRISAGAGDGGGRPRRAGADRDRVAG